jgi:hypothetical protein
MGEVWQVDPLTIGESEEARLVQSEWTLTLQRFNPTGKDQRSRL